MFQFYKLILTDYLKTQNVIVYYVNQVNLIFIFMKIHFRKKIFFKN